MKINFDAKILDLNSKEIVDQNNKSTTLGTVASQALMAAFPDETNLEASEKVKRFKLSLKVVKGGSQDISVDDVSELKKLIGKAYGPLVVGRAYDLIEGEN